MKKILCFSLFFTLLNLSLFSQEIPAELEMVSELSTIENKIENEKIDSFNKTYIFLKENKVDLFELGIVNRIEVSNLISRIESMIPKNSVFVEGGTFQMGSTAGDDDKPIHSVTLSDFYMSKYEVTQGEYKGLMGKSPSDSKYGIGDNYPVNKVSWNDAVEYCNALSRKEGLTPAYSGSGDNVRCNFNANGYRLPTEAEWEYAARGGKSSKSYTYAGSNNIDAVAWYWRNSGDKTLSGDWNWNKIEANNGKNHPVGQKQANELGLYDMSGNVYEWCWDWYGSYSSDTQSDPTGTSPGTSRIGRGGSWGADASNSRSAYRYYYIPSNRNRNLGFRVVRRL
jgi:formylglycine-generating enzyme required for sulfatase activity